MQKGKFFMGLGLGVVCGSLLLQLMISVERMENQAALTPEEMAASDALEASIVTEQQLFSAAEALHYKLFPVDQVLYTEEQLDEAVDQAIAQAAEEAMQLENERKMLFVINPGMKPLDVANMLVRLELIEDQDELLQIIRERQLSTRIVSGTYMFEGEPTIDEIVEQITY